MDEEDTLGEIENLDADFDADDSDLASAEHMLERLRDEVR